MKHRIYFIAISLIAACLLVKPATGAQTTLPIGASVMANGTLTPVTDLKAGDIVETTDGKKLRITSVREVERRAPIHCIATPPEAGRVAYVLGSGVAAAGAQSTAHPGTGSSATITRHPRFSSFAAYLRSNIWAVSRQSGRPADILALTNLWTSEA